MKPLALLSWALLAASSPGDEEHQVRKLLPALEDDSVERRDKAAAGLFALGEPAVPALRAALETSLSPEARARIGDVLHRLEAARLRRDSKGGEVQDGLCATLRLLEEGPSGLMLQVEVMNVSEKARPFIPIKWWNLRLPGDVFLSNLSEATIEVKPLSGQSLQPPRRGRL